MPIFLRKDNFTLMELQDMVDSLIYVFGDDAEMELIQTGYFFGIGKRLES